MFHRFKFYGSHMFSYDYLNRDTPMLRKLDSLVNKNILLNNTDNAKKYLKEFRENLNHNQNQKLFIII